MSLEQLRKRLSAVDRELIELIADRQRIVAEVSAHKIQSGAPTRDFEREREVLHRARQQALKLGLDPGLAEDVMRALIRSSLTHQEQTRVAEESSGAGKRALIIGGAGKMGGWMADFLASQGFEVELADPVAADSPYRQMSDWSDSDLGQEIIVVAAPLEITAEILEQLAERRPAGLILDVGSLKRPLQAGLKALAEVGCRVTSIHPMFGPDTRLLSGRHVIFVDVGVTEATAEARALFSSTMAERIDMSLEEHDRLIAYVLGLSHALNLAFFTALAGSGELVPRLKQVSSTTFDAQLDVASRVAYENPRLYFEIQALNQYGGAALDALLQATRRIHDLVQDNDVEGFVELMEAGRRYLDSNRGR